MVRSLLPLILTVSLMAPSTGIAEITGRDAWNALLRTTSDLGGRLTAGAIVETETGLSAREIQAIWFDTNTNRHIVTFPDLQLTEQNGQVTFGLPPEFLIRTGASLSRVASTGLSGNIRPSGLQVVASGTPDSVRFDVTLDTATFELNSDLLSVTANDVSSLTGEVSNLRFTVAPNEVDPPLGLTMDQLILRHRTDNDDGFFRNINTFDGITVAGSVTEPASGLRLPSVLGSARIERHLFNQFSSSNSRALGTDSIMAQMVLNWNLDRERFDLTTEVAEGIVRVNVPRSIYPMAILRWAGGSAALSTPAPRSTDSGLMSLTAEITTLAIDDGVWQQIDPSGEFDRNPGAFKIQATGVTKEPGQRLGRVSPDTVTVENAELKLAGATASVEGTVEFQPDPELGQDMPKGRLDVTVDGGYGLIDGAVATGLLPAPLGQMARMMMSQFVVQVDEAKFTTDVTFGNGASMTLNGTPLPFVAGK